MRARNNVKPQSSAEEEDKRYVYRRQSAAAGGGKCRQTSDNLRGPLTNHAA